MELVLGGGKVIKGWEEGLKGMCVGELRRLTVPSKLGYGEAGTSNIPGGATLLFEIRLVTLNGQSLEQLEAAVAADDASAVDSVLAERFGQRTSPYCDACETFVEEFFESWVVMLQKQNDKVETKNGGSSAPALTYNDEVEATVQVCRRHNPPLRTPEESLGLTHSAVVSEHALRR